VERLPLGVPYPKVVSYHFRELLQPFIQQLMSTGAAGF